MEARSIGRTLVEWTQAPSWAVSKLVYDFIVPPVPPTTVIAVLTVLFLMQTAILALPVWLLTNETLAGESKLAHYSLFQRFTREIALPFQKSDMGLAIQDLALLDHPVELGGGEPARLNALVFHRLHFALR
jgi:hypothetical protein